MITAFAQGKGKDHDPVNSLGSYFERPGRTILENHLLDVPSCESVLGESTTLIEDRVYFAGEFFLFFFFCFWIDRCSFLVVLYVVFDLSNDQGDGSSLFYRTMVSG